MSQLHVREVAIGRCRGIGGKGPRPRGWWLNLCILGRRRRRKRAQFGGGTVGVARRSAGTAGGPMGGSITVRVIAVGVLAGTPSAAVVEPSDGSAAAGTPPQAAGHQGQQDNHQEPLTPGPGDNGRREEAANGIDDPSKGLGGGHHHGCFLRCSSSE